MRRFWILAATIGLLFAPLGMATAKNKPGKGNKPDKWAQKQWKDENKYWEKQDKQADKNWQKSRKAEAKHYDRDYDGWEYPPPPPYYRLRPAYRDYYDYDDGY